MLKNLKRNARSTYVNEQTGIFQDDVRKVLNGAINREQLISVLTPLSTLERWIFLTECLKQKQSNVLHFLHIPKTGGTSFGETLGQDKKAVIISVDALPETFAGQIMRFQRAKPEELVVTRAHHSLKLVEMSGCLEFISLVLTAYRNPLEVHISNVNMIMRRVANYVKGSQMPAAEKIFCEQWLQDFSEPFTETKAFAIRLLKSDIYRKRMGGIYSLFLKGSSWKKLHRKGKLVVIASEKFDAMFTDVFDYQVLPERKNVSLAPMISVSDIAPSSLASLVKNDKSISVFMDSNLVEPKDLRGLIFSWAD